MNKEQALQKLAPYVEAARVEGDTYFILHIDGHDDKYHMRSNGDAADILTLVVLLIQRYNFSIPAIEESLKRTKDENL